MQFQRLTFTNPQGEKLAARLDLPLDRKPLAYALFAHCFTCSKNLNAVVNINRALTREGIAVMRFDFTGLGESEGDFAATNFSSNVDDLVAAADFLEENYEAPKLLIGHSLGGAAVLQAAARIRSARAVATIGAPYDPVHVVQLLDGKLEDINQSGMAEVTLAGRSFKITRQFVEDLEQTRMQHAIAELDRALMVFHSPLDHVVGIENASLIFQAARHPKSLVSLDRADHLLSEQSDSLYVGSVLSAWARKYLGIAEPSVLPGGPPDHTVRVETGKTGYQTEIRVDSHRLIADEPIGLGGADTGPSPYEYLAGALGACTTITLRMYADRKSLPLESIRVHLKHSKVHAQDCEQCEAGTSLVDRIEREIELVGPLDQDQRARLLEIADRCPVHRTLKAGVDIATTLKEP